VRLEDPPLNPVTMWGRTRLTISSRSRFVAARSLTSKVLRGLLFPSGFGNYYQQPICAGLAGVCCYVIHHKGICIMYIMASILFVYSSVLALALWQEKRNDESKS
jgi:hypothetical protein